MNSSTVMRARELAIQVGRGWRAAAVAAVVTIAVVALAWAGTSLDAGQATAGSFDTAVVRAAQLGSSPSAPVVTAPVVTAAVAPQAAPGAPRVSAKAGDARVTVRWAASTTGGSATSYVVQRWSQGAWRTVATTSATKRSYVVTGLPNGYPQKFQVVAKNAAGKTASATVSGKPLGVASAPKVSAKAGNGRVTVQWAAPSSNGGSAITGYLVQRYSGGTWRTVATASASARSHVVTGLPNGWAQKFRVVAKSAVGTGKPSTHATATPKAPPAPPKPTTPTKPAKSCHPAYLTCLPIVDDLDCSDVDGPIFLYDAKNDPYRLDSIGVGDGVGCEP